MSDFEWLENCLKFFNVKSMDSFDERFLVQKYVYFAQRVGSKMKFEYNLYKQGPYSPSLTATAYSLLGTSINKVKANITSKKDKLTLQKTQEFVKNLSQQDLEILTTLDYLILCYPKPVGRDQIEARLHRLKEWTRDIPLDSYWEKLEDFGLLEHS